MAQISGHLPKALRTDRAALEHSPALQAFWILRVGLAAAAIIAGADKFFDALLPSGMVWRSYLAPWVADALGAEGSTWFMRGVGVVEIAVGIGILIWPRIFGYVLSAWLLGIIINLLIFPPGRAHYDIALRDLGLCLGAFCLGKLAYQFGAPGGAARIETT